MRWDDLLYGTFEIPQEVWSLFGDPLLVRLRGISQAVLPVELNPFSTAVNRFQHGIGVWRLAAKLCERDEFSFLAPSLPLAGLLHDAGNPPFSHTGDWFMREAIGHDGESRLHDLLFCSELEGTLRGMGADPQFVCDLVAGRAKPWSDLLNGSLDLDNLDNIRRYAVARGLEGASYSAHAIVGSFRLSPGGDAIELDSRAFTEVQRWKMARRVVYASVYSEPHLALAMMLHRAVEIAHAEGELDALFFRLDDREALDFLAGECNRGSRMLADALRRLQPYQLIGEWDGAEPPFDYECPTWIARKAVSDDLASAAGVQPWEAAAYIGPGNDRRKIILPFRSENGEVCADRDSGAPTWRIRLYLKRPPSPATRPFIRDVPGFCRLAVGKRIPAPIAAQNHYDPRAGL